MTDETQTVKEQEEASSEENSEESIQETEEEETPEKNPETEETPKDGSVGRFSNGRIE